MNDVLERLKNNEYKAKEEEVKEKTKSRFIIGPDNYWNLQRNNAL